MVKYHWEREKCTQHMFNMVIWHQSEERKEGNVLFSDALNAFYLWLYGKEGSVLFNDSLNTCLIWLYGIRVRKGRKEMFYLATHSTHFTYGYMGRKEVFYLTTHSTHV